MGDEWAEMAKVAAMLEARGTRLRPPADLKALAHLEDTIGGRLSDQASALFQTFDGFIDEIPDDKTMVCIWSVERIICVTRESRIATGHAIGDHFLAADFFCCDLRNSASRVWRQECGSIVAGSLLEFCQQISEGTLAP